jgi:hypothetical protein
VVVRKSSMRSGRHVPVLHEVHGEDLPA